MKLIKYGDSGDQVKEVQELLRDQGFFKRGIPRGNFKELTRSSLFHFQCTHLGPDGLFLDADCIVGPNTMWSLNNASEDPQASDIPPIIPSGLSGPRNKVLKAAIADRELGVKEEPNGSNWGPEIKKYGGRKGWAWCALAMNYWYKKGINIYPAGRIQPSCYRNWKAAEKNGMWRDKQSYVPMPGDAFIMQYKNAAGKYTGLGHTGIVLRVSDEGKLINSIEGNVSNRVKITLREIHNHKIIGYINPFGTEVVTDFEKGVMYGKIDKDSLKSTR